MSELFWSTFRHIYWTPIVWYRPLKLSPHYRLSRIESGHAPT